MSKKNVTIYDVADASGASATTVAAVLNGKWKERRVAEATVKKVQSIASKLGYRPNLQARGLRSAQSRMVGMIVPIHDNRYFSSLAEHFEIEARRRDLCPVVVSTMRDPEEELRTVDTLIAHNVDQIFIAGATDPNPLGKMCTDAGIPHVNVDLPGSQCRSVISDNYWGACRLTEHLLASLQKPNHASVSADIYFLGGNAKDYNTQQRAKAFKDTVKKAGFERPSANAIDMCGYAAESAEEAAKQMKSKLGKLPSALFVNSTIAFEGVFRFLKDQPESETRAMSIGCYDWDPFLSSLQFPVAMVRQNAGAMMSRAFELMDSGEYQATGIELITPEIMF